MSLRSVNTSIYKKMKFRTLIVCLVSMMIVSPLFGQGGRGQGGGQYRQQMTEENVKQRVENIAQFLAMDAEQEKQILDYELETFEKNKIERERLRGDREGMRSYMQKQREERDEKYKEVLSEEQYKQYVEQREQRRQNSQGGQRPGRSGNF